MRTAANVSLPHIKAIKVIYTESQIYEYIARVFYNVVFSLFLGSNAAEKRVWYINISLQMQETKIVEKKNCFQSSSNI